MNKPYVSRDVIVAKAQGMEDAGMMHHMDLEWLYDQAAKYEVVAEVGCWKGRTTMVMAAAGPRIVYAVDTWEGSSEPGDNTHGVDREALYKTFLRNTAQFPTVLPIMCQSNEGVKYIMGDVDFCFIDADHSYEYVKRDIEAWLPRTRYMLYGHDPYLPGVQKAVIEVLGEGVIDYKSGIWKYEVPR